MNGFNVNFVLECANCEVDLDFTAYDKYPDSDLNCKDMVFRVKQCDCRVKDD